VTSIPDLTPYTYTAPLFPGELAVGWLDADDVIPSGELPQLLRSLIIERLTFAAAYLQSGTAALMGTHSCAFCDGPREPLPNHALWGSGELRVVHHDGTVYVSPSLIAHYIAEHSYVPPEVFIEAVAAGTFVEQPRPQLDRPVVDRLGDAPADLKARTGSTGIVHGHIETWNRVPSPPILGIAVGRRWYGPWDGTIDQAIALLDAETPLGFTPG
jgi:hypothetical protein